MSSNSTSNPFANLSTRDLVGHNRKVHSVDWNCTGKYLASGSVDQTARVWDVEHHSSNREMVLRGHSSSVDQLCWHPSTPYELATASSDKSVRFWDTRSGKCTHTIATSGENINLAWNKQGTEIAVGNKNDLISIIDTRKYKALKTAQFPFEVNEISWNEAGNLFFLCTGNGSVEILRYPELKTTRSLKGHSAIVYALALSDKYLAVGSADALVSIWSLDEFVCVRTLSKLEWPVRTISFSHNGQYLASGSEDLVLDIVSDRSKEDLCVFFLTLGTDCSRTWRAVSACWPWTLDVP
mmetsp:Transcript_12786/g.21732  ORF Transcript_12786/g.21732 Transcript_12786/m.21732 type:complete len:296 (-) Transcript_12786:288-1175(-)